MCSSTTQSVDRVEVWERLDHVHDPELDRSIVELKYIDEIRIDAACVTVEFVLPTAWCSPAFAWMMATGIRDEVGTLSSVDDVHVELRDHMHSEQINRGVNERLAFQAVFEDAEDGIEEVQRTLNQKARLARQYDAIETLLDAGLEPEQIVELTRGDLEFSGDRVAIFLHEETVAVTVPAEPLSAYLEKAQEVEIVTGPDGVLFRGLEGNPIDRLDFESVHRRTRLAKTNMSGQAGICTQLHEVRNGAGVDEN